MVFHSILDPFFIYQKHVMSVVACRVAVRVVLACITIIPLMAALILEIKLVKIGAVVTFGVYGFWITLHTLLQVVFSLRNYHDMENLHRCWEFHENGTIGLQVVGYQEDPVLFKQCCESVKTMREHHEFITQVVCVVDGNETEADLQMVDVFRQVFPHAAYYNLKLLPTVPFHVPESENVYIVTQPHGGKRDALRTAMLQNLASDVDYIMLVDSDTIVDREAPMHLKKVLDRDVNKRLGAVAGDIRIFNVTNLLTLLISLKYFMAFNLERAAQSTFNVVACVGGPLGLYRSEVIEQVLDKWYHQHFLGKPCTYGDDRHLTNQVLHLGLGVKYNHRAFCYTDTPESLKRWMLQQTRWNKSGLREFWITVQALHKHSLWLTFDLIFLTFYSFFIVAILITVLLEFSVRQLVGLYGVIFVISGLRSFYGLIMKHDWHFLTLAWYGFIYLHVILPCKLWASVTLWSTGWGTSSRFYFRDSWTSVLPLIVWNGLLATGSALTFQKDWDNFSPILSLVLGCLVLGSLLFAVSKSCILRGVQQQIQTYLNRDSVSNLLTLEDDGQVSLVLPTV